LSLVFSGSTSCKTKTEEGKALLDATLWRSDINIHLGGELDLPLMTEMFVFCVYFHVILHVVLKIVLFSDFMLKYFG